MCTLVFFVFCFVNCSDNAFISEKLLCCKTNMLLYILCKLESSKFEFIQPWPAHRLLPIEVYSHSIHRVVSITCNWLSVHSNTNTTWEVLFLECTVNAGNSRGKKILCCENFSVQKNLLSSTFFNNWFETAFLSNDKVSWDIKPYDCKISCFK